MALPFWPQLPIYNVRLARSGDPGGQFGCILLVAFHVDPDLTIEDTVLPLKSLSLGSSCPYSSEHQGWSASWVKVEGLPLPRRTLPAPRFLDSLTLRFCISNILSISDFTGLWFLVLLPQNLQPPSTVFKPQGENSAFWQIDIFHLTLLYSLLPGPEEVAVAGQGGQR